MSGTGEVVGRVAAVWRYPVKSMRGEQVDATDIREAGVVGDRAFALYDVETGKVASAKSPRMWPNLLDFSASFVASPAGGALPAARIDVPGGGVVHTDDPAVDEVLSQVTGRKVRLVTSNPAGATYEQYVPPVEGADPEGADFYREFPNDVFQTGSLYDAAPVHLLTTGTVDGLNGLADDSDFDARRFRPNIVVETEGGAPFPENGWVKGQLVVGDVRLRVTMPTMRCVMTTRPQDDLPHDLGILRALVRHNRLDVLGLGAFPCAGVYGLVEQPGSVRVGDTVSLVAD